MNLLADPSWWVWIERATWIIAFMVGVPSLFATWVQIRALRAEQQRFAKEVTEKPSLQAGFGVGIESSRTLRLDRHEPVPWRSKVVPFDIHIINNGKKSARDILLNVLFDSVIQSEHAKRSIRSIDGRHFGPEEDSGTSIIVCRRGYIHPDDYDVVELAWHFPFRSAEYDVLVEASATDMEPMSTRLKLRVATDPEVRHVLLGR